MGIKNKQIEIHEGYRNKPPTIERELGVEELTRALEQLGMIVNQQTSVIRNLSNKLSEVLFKLGKQDEQLQLQRVEQRLTKDKLDIVLKSLVELGVIDRDIFELTASMIEDKTLPINRRGKINASIMLTRYNNPNIPAPKDFQHVGDITK